MAMLYLDLPTRSGVATPITASTAVAGPTGVFRRDDAVLNHEVWARTNVEFTTAPAFRARTGPSTARFPPWFAEDLCQ